MGMKLFTPPAPGSSLHHAPLLSLTSKSALVYGRVGPRTVEADGKAIQKASCGITREVKLQITTTSIVGGDVKVISDRFKSL
jgi:hypothetical protein